MDLEAHSGLSARGDKMTIEQQYSRVAQYTLIELTAHVAAILANPLATPDEIAWLRNQDPRGALRHSNCPTELWWELAKYLPQTAQQSILFPLLTLESPERWNALVREQGELWLMKGCDHLSEADQHSFAADCAELILPAFLAERPDDDRPAKAIALHRQIVTDPTLHPAWADACKEAYEAAGACASVAADIAARSASQRSPLNAILEALRVLSWCTEDYAVYLWEGMQNYLSPDVL